MARVTPITNQTVLVDPETGLPTPFFLKAWDALTRLGLIDLADVEGTPANGDTLVYNGATGKWEPQ